MRKGFPPTQFEPAPFGLPVHCSTTWAKEDLFPRAYSLNPEKSNFFALLVTSSRRFGGSSPGFCAGRRCKRLIFKRQNITIKLLLKLLRLPKTLLYFLKDKIYAGIPFAKCTPSHTTLPVPPCLASRLLNICQVQEELIRLLVINERADATHYVRFVAKGAKGRRVAAQITTSSCYNVTFFWHFLRYE